MARSLTFSFVVAPSTSALHRGQGARRVHEARDGTLDAGSDTENSWPTASDHGQCEDSAGSHASSGRHFNLNLSKLRWFYGSEACVWCRIAPRRSSFGNWRIVSWILMILQARGWILSCTSAGCVSKTAVTSPTWQSRISPQRWRHCPRQSLRQDEGPKKRGERHENVTCSRGPSCAAAQPRVNSTLSVGIEQRGKQL